MVQEVFMHLWENSETMDIQTNIRGYLYAMVRNRCLNILKSVRITDTAGVLELQSLPDTTYNPDYPFDPPQGYPQVQLQGVLEKLPSRMRTIVRLRFVDNYKYAEIAEELGVSVNTIKTQLRRAKLKLAQYILAVVALLSVL